MQARLGEMVPYNISSSWIWIGLIVTFFIIQWARSLTGDGEESDKQPKRLRYVIPFIGHAFKLAGDKKKFFMESL